MVLGISILASLWVAVLVWRRDDHVLFKCAATLITFIPVLGPLFGLWVTSFPDKMHPDMQAKYKNAVNVYSVPKESIEARARGAGSGDAV